jgi:hypothetical protein
MWFLNSHPESVNVKLFAETFGKGYQHTALQFTVSNNAYMVVPFPWSVDKENGSFKVIVDNKLDSIVESSNPSSKVLLTEKDIKLYENVRKIKKESDPALLDLPIIREMWDIYTEEDYGVFVVKAEKDKVYRIDYTHKLSILSSLFIQTRFSNLHSLKGCKFSMNIWIGNGRKDNIPKFLVSEGFSDGLDKYGFSPKFDWCEDVRIATDCWESSDESGLDSNDENEEE